jgi:transcriptional regulator with GAF, ATPase, and Fis domain
MSNEFVNQITLDCLLNKKQYEKYVATQVSKSVHEEERKFYRKRIYCLTKELLLSKEEPENLLPDVKYAFDQYVKSCIHYFKVLDSHDILQQEYKEIQEEQEEQEEQEQNSRKTELLDQVVDSSDNFVEPSLTTRKIKSFYSSLDPFVTITSTKPAPEQIILPQQREVNLQDPTLMNKGILSSSEKKKNLTNV